MENLKEVKTYVELLRLDTKCKEQYLVYQRYYLYKYLRITFNLTFADIGAIFKRNHATIIHGIGKYEDLKGTNVFIDDVCHLIESFPIKTEMEYLTKSLANANIVMAKLDKKQYLKLYRFRLDNNLNTNEKGIQLLIDMILH